MDWNPDVSLFLPAAAANAPPVLARAGFLQSRNDAAACRSLKPGRRSQTHLRSQARSNARLPAPRHAHDNDEHRALALPYPPGMLLENLRLAQNDLLLLGALARLVGDHGATGARYTTDVQGRFVQSRGQVGCVAVTNKEARRVEASGVLAECPEGKLGHGPCIAVA